MTEKQTASVVAQLEKRTQRAIESIRALGRTQRVTLDQGKVIDEVLTVAVDNILDAWSKAEAPNSPFRMPTE